VNPTSGAPTEAASFLVAILPFLDQANISEGFRTAFNGGGANLAAGSSPLPIFQCASARQNDGNDDLYGGVSASHYVGVGGSASTNPDIGEGIGSPGTIEYRVFANGATDYASAGGLIGLDGLFSPFASDRLVLMNNAPVAACTRDTSTRNIGTNFAGFANNKGLNFEDIGDGSSNTFAIGEFSGSENRQLGFVPLKGSWAVGAIGPMTGAFDGSFFVPITTTQVRSVIAPINSTNPAHYLPANFNAAPFNSNHPGGAQFSRADGSTAFVAEDLSVANLAALCGVDDGNIINDF
jgi:hypothetical protein